MKKSLASRVGVAAAFTVVGLFGAGSAGAVNEYEGLTYEKASTDASNGGWTVVINTRIGDYLPLEQCIVTGNRPGGGSGRKLLMDLNCNDVSALNGHPGNSVATPAGAKALQRRDLAVRFSNDYAKLEAAGKAESFGCLTSDDNVTFCQKLCSETKACSAELEEALGV